MADRLVIYLVAHQPRRLRLPAAGIPADLPPEKWEGHLFDDPMNRRYLEKVAASCYRPATRMFLELADQGLCLAVGMSWSLLEQMRRWDPALLDLFKELLAHPNVDLVGVEPYQTYLSSFDIERFVERMKWARERLSDLAEKPVRLGDALEECISNDLYYAYAVAGFEALIIDGREWILGWRQPSYLYRLEPSPKIMCRHFQLSDDVGFRFANKLWKGYPLLADNYASWIREATGDVILLGWDYETFGEHHNEATGIFTFMRSLPEALKVRGVHSMTPAQVMRELRDETRYLAVPQSPGAVVGPEAADPSLRNAAQQAVYQFMGHAYNKARLTRSDALVDVALRLMTADNLHILQWWKQSGSDAEISSYFLPEEWWSLGPDEIVAQIQEVYKQFIVACDPHVPIKRPAKSPPSESDE